MKTLILSTFDIDGGAARAAYRLHQGLHSIGISSQMLVKNKFSNDRTVFAPPRKLNKLIGKFRQNLDRLPLNIYRSSTYADRTFSLQWVGDAINKRVQQIDPDAINLHWGLDYVQIESIAQFAKPVIWTLHDMWAFTGGCLYSGDCDRYTDSCGNCPQLNSGKSWDLSRWIWQKKAKSWMGLNLTIVTPSKWLAECATSSSLFRNVRVEVIPNSLDTQKYKPIDRFLARKWLNLPQHKRLILFGALSANDTRKGFHLLAKTLASLSDEHKDQIELVVFGASQPDSQQHLGLKSHYLGSLKDDISLALVYAAADVFVAPSVQDNLPNTVMEALACGTPCVAFNIGGMPDMIDHQHNGYLAQPFEPESLAAGINWVLADSDRTSSLCQAARLKVEQEFSLPIQAHRYTDLFADVIDRANQST